MRFLGRLGVVAGLGLAAYAIGSAYNSAYIHGQQEIREFQASPASKHKIMHVDLSSPRSSQEEFLRMYFVAGSNDSTSTSESQIQGLSTSDIDSIVCVALMNSGQIIRRARAKDGDKHYCISSNRDASIIAPVDSLTQTQAQAALDVFRANTVLSRAFPEWR